MIKDIQRDNVRQGHFDHFHGNGINSNGIELSITDEP